MKPLSIFHLAVIAGLIIKSSFAQTVQWAHSGISPGYEDGNSITVDDSGNVYVAGQIEYTTHFDGGQRLSSWGSHDIFAMKYAPDGTVKWLHNAGGRSGDVGYGVAVDGMHNCYATGEIEDTAKFSSGVSLISKGGNDIFVSKYGMTGQLIWAKSFGSTESDKGYSMIANTNGDIFVTGFYSAHIYFDNIHLTPAGLADFYLLKLNTNGIVQWAKKGAGTENDRGKGVTLDRNGNIYVAGFFTGQATFSGTTITNNGTTGGFLVKYDPSGSLVWIRGNCCGTSEYDAIAIDENGNIYTTGYFTGTITIGNTTLTSTGNADILIVKYDPSGNVIWAKKAGGPNEDIANGITVDSIHRMFYITGQLDDHGNFGSLSVEAAGNRDVFIAAYDLNGSSQWVKSYGGTQRDISYGITNDRNGYILNTGIYTGTASFGNYTLPHDLLSEYYVQKVSPRPASPPAVAASNLAINFANCTDLSLDFTPGSGDGRIIIAHAGSPVHQLPVNGTAYHANRIFGSGDNLGSGNYVVYNGTGNSVTVTGLTRGVTYYFSVFEYNGSGILTGYLANNPAISSHAAGTFSVDIQAGSNLFCEGDTITLTATGGESYSWAPAAALSASTGYMVSAFPVSTTVITVTANKSGCFFEDEITITVNQLPLVSFSLNTSICENSGDLILTGGTPAGGVYSGPGVFSGTFDPTVPGAGNVPITYSFTDSAGCINSAITTVTVLLSPVVSFSLSNNNICDNASPVILTGGSPPGGEYYGNGVFSGSFDPSIAGAGLMPLSYVYSDSLGCSDTAIASMNVLLSPVTTFVLNNPSICENVGPVVLSGGSPTGGEYSGNGVISGSFDPSIPGIGTVPVTYTYIDTNGCSNSASGIITVLEAPYVSLGTDSIICAYNSITLDAGSGFSTYLWSNGSTLPSLSVDSSGTGLGTENIFVVVENNSGCINSDTIQLTFTLCTGIENVNGISGLHFYPNPFTNTLYLQSEQKSDVFIYDASGKLVDKLQGVEGETNFGENFAAGMYTIIVFQDKRKSVFKVVKNAGY